MNVTTSDLDLHVAGLLHHFFEEMSGRPGAYQPEIGMFLSDEEKASMYSSDLFFLTAIGRAEKEDTGSASRLRTAFENTRTNQTAAAGLRLRARREAAVNTAAAVTTTPPIKQPALAARTTLGDGSESDDDLRAGLRYLQQSRQIATAPTATPDDGFCPPPEGTMDDVIASLAIVGGGGRARFSPSLLERKSRSRRSRSGTTGSSRPRWKTTGNN